MRVKSLPDADLVRRLVRYDRLTGKLFWLPRSDSSLFSGPRALNLMGVWNARYAGKEAFNKLSIGGYLVGKLLGESFASHRIAWLIETGEEPEFVDHISGDKTDNRLTNLRSVSWSENTKNKPKPSNNKSGTIGVHWVPRSMRWRAFMSLGRKVVLQREFADLQDAVIARREAEIMHGFHPNHGRAA